MIKTLVLFDIDGTLLMSDGAGRMALSSSLGTYFGRPIETQGVAFTGRTDRAIIHSILEHNGISLEDLEPVYRSVFARFGEHVREAAQQRPIWVLPGVHELLAALSRRDDTGVGLVTGNSVAGAFAKLHSAGLETGQFVVGAYGSEAYLRNDLPPLALKRAEKLFGHLIPPKNVIVVGDTPLDIECARVNGMRSAAVATGWHTFEELALHNADILWEDLADTEGVVRGLLNGH